jgi:hypothetical protein
LNTITKRTAAFVLIGAIAALSFMIGCDDRNEADIPQPVFTYAGGYTTGSTIKHVVADGNYATIAASVAGMFVLDVSNPGSVSEVYRFRTEDNIGSNWVAMSSEYGIAATFLDLNTGYFGWSAVFNFLTGDTIGVTGFTGPLADFALQAGTQPSTESFYFWGSDRIGPDGLVGIRYCHLYIGTDSVKWATSGCPFTVPHYIPPRDNIRGFGIKDSLMAIAIDVDGIHLYAQHTNTNISDLYTPGIANDCAWYGNYIIVADRYFVTVVDASDPANPEIVSSLTIDGADRLVSVEVDGNHAAVLDEADGVYIVDLADPANLKMVQEIKLSEPSSICADNGRLYITDEQQGLLIYTR